MFKKNKTGRSLLSEDLYSAVAQLREYIGVFLTNGRKLLDDKGERYKNMKPSSEGYLIIGDIHKELEGKTDEEKKDYVDEFERFRIGQKEIKIITYSEIGDMIKIIANVSDKT